ncbi:hypothetical protein D9M71_564560 [compost metagenome]
MVRLAPLPQANDLAGQYRSQPQQMRSGWLGFVGNFLGMVSFPQRQTDLRLCCVPASGLIEINLGEEYSRYKPQLTNITGSVVRWTRCQLGIAVRQMMGIYKVPGLQV